MTTQEKKFYEFWNTNLKGKVTVPTAVLTEAYFHLYNKQWYGGACSVCLRQLGQELKDRFYAFDKLVQAEQIIESLKNETPEPPKNKGGRPKKIQ